MKLVHKGDLKHAKKRLQTLRELVEGGPASDESKEARKAWLEDRLASPKVEPKSNVINSKVEAKKKPKAEPKPKPEAKPEPEAEPAPAPAPEPAPGPAVAPDGFEWGGTF